MTGVSPNNSPINVIPALRNTIQNTSATVPNGFANPSSVNYLEPGYFAVPQMRLVSLTTFNLRLLKNTAFSIGKNMYFGQTTSFKIYYGPLTKYVTIVHFRLLKQYTQVLPKLQIYNLC